MDREVSVLFLDDTPFDPNYIGQSVSRLLNEFKDRGLVAAISTKKWTANAFAPSDSELALVDEMTRVYEFDAIIIGNNVRGGVPVVAAISPKIRDRIIVVSNTGTVPFPDEYANLGVSRFGRRLREVDAVMELLGIKRQ